MGVFAQKTELTFEPKMRVAMDAAPATVTVAPEALRPVLGPIANVPYKLASLGYLVRLSAAPTVGEVSVRLMAGPSVVAEKTFSVIGVTELSDRFDVDLAGIEGQTKLAFEVEVETAADAGITADVDAKVDIQQPLAQSGC